MNRPPRIAIVGRPNVGKSSLFNRLAGRRISIVDPTPGVTRDRVTAQVELVGEDEKTKSCELIDTGGYGVYTAEGNQFNEVGADLTTLTPDIERQIIAAYEQANLILFVTDAKSGLTSLDHVIANLIRESGHGKKVLAVANKVDDQSRTSHGLETSELGFGEPVCVSATTGFGVRSLAETMYERIREVASAPVRPDEIKLAILGKRNSGKSTLINAWAGEPRVIVSEIAGTTRDAVDVRFELGGRTILAIDTAGVRKRKSFVDDVEYYAHTRMLASIKRADVAMLLLDASADVSQVDKKLALELQKQFKPTVIVVNKWDLAKKKKLKSDDYQEYLTEQLRGLDYAPIVFISAKESEGIHDLAAMAFNLHEQALHRESTGQLNAAIQRILKQRGPSSKLGTQAKLYYATQVATNPPTIVVVVNEPKLFEGNYERYLFNELREVVPFSEIPFRVIFRRRERVSLTDLKSRPAGSRA